MAGIKVGEGYIEISPKIKGINRDLHRDIQNRLNEIDDGKFKVAPKVTGITKAFQKDIQNELNKTITDLEVKVKVKIDDTTLKASFGNVVISSKSTGKQAGDGMADGVDDGLNRIKRAMRETEVAIKTGVTPPNSGEVKQRLDVIGDVYKGFSEKVKNLTDGQVNTVRSGVNELGTLQNHITRTMDKEAAAQKKAADDLEREIRRTISETDKMVNSASAGMKDYSTRFSKHLRDMAVVVKPVVESIRTEFDRIAPSINKMSNDSLNAMDKFKRGIFDVQKTVREGFKEATEKGFDGVAQVFKDFADGNGINLPDLGAKAGKSFGGALSEAVSTTVRFGMARMVAGLPLMIAGFSYALGPVISGISQLVAGFTLLASQAAYAAGALAAVPAAFGAIIQAGGVLQIAFTGIGDALSALQAEEEGAAQASQATAKAMEAASRQVENAKRALADAQRDAAERIARSEESAARASEEGAQRVSAAQERLSEVTQNAADKISRAQENVTEAHQQAAQKIEQAQARLVDAQADAAASIESAQEKLADAMRDSAERVTDAQERLAEVQADVADRVADAQARLVEVSEGAAERIAEAELSLARTRVDAARSVADAQQRLTDAITDGVRRTRDAERDYAETIRGVTDAQEGLNRAREEAAERLEDLANSVLRGALDEEGAQIAIEEAAARLAEVNANPEATDLARRKADLAYREALQRLVEIRERNEDLRKEQELGNAEGVEGSREVRDAKDAVERAIQRQIEAEEKLREAQAEAAKEAAEAAERLARAREEAAEKVADAEKRLGDTRRDAIRDVADAEKALGDARIDGVKRIRDAEDSLRDAQQDGIRKIQDAERALEDARRDGARKIQEAEQALENARRDGVKRIADAEKALEDARKDAVKDIAKAEKDLENARVDAARNVADAEKDLARTREDGARSVSDAQRNLQEAMEAVTQALEGQNAAASKTEEALKKLSPAAREFVFFIRDELLPKFEEIQFAIQDSFFPPLQRAMENSGPLLDLFKDKLSESGRILGEVAASFINFLNTDESRNRIANIMDSNNRLFETFRQSVNDAGTALLILVEGSGPFLERMAEKIGNIVSGIRKWIEEAEKNGTLEEFFRRVEETLNHIGQIVRDVGTGIAGIFDESYEPGKKLLGVVGQAAKEFREWVDSTEGKNELKQWFERGRKTMEELLFLLEDIIEAFFKAGKNTDWDLIVKAIRTDLLPALQDLIDTFSDDDGHGLIKLVESLAVVIKGVATAADLVHIAFAPMLGDLKGLYESLDNLIERFTGLKTNLGDLIPTLTGIGKTHAETLDEAVKRTFDSTEMASKYYWYLIRTYGQEAADQWAKIQRDAWAASSGIKTETSSNFSGMKIELASHHRNIEGDARNSWDNVKSDANNKTRETTGIVAANTAEMNRRAIAEMASMNKGMSTQWDGAVRSARTAAQGIVDGAGSQTGNLQTIGWNAGVGFWNGLADAWNRIIEWWNQNVNGLVDIAKRILGIASPSKVFIEVGANLVEGMAIGIKDSYGLITDAVSGMADVAIGSWDGKLTSPILPTIPEVPKYTSPVQPVEAARRYSTQPFKGDPRGGTTYNLTMNAAPTVPTERQMLTMLSYADSLFK